MTLFKEITSLFRSEVIVLFGGYPYQRRQNNGYFQRVKSINSLFSEKTRIYIDRVDFYGKSIWFDRPSPNVLVININGNLFQKLITGIFAILCILLSRNFYFHSVFSIKRFKWVMYLPFKRKFVDFHGVVPEEFLYQQDFENAKSFGAIENLAVNKADFLIVVTEAMRKHFIQKYGKVINGQFITLPILPEFTTSNKQSISSKREDKPIIIYAGGLQKWQQVQKMVDVIRQTADNYHYKFFCPDPEKIKTFLTEDFIKSHDIEIDDISHNDLIKEYEKSDYGLILREDIVINQVACPTKLVEYLASGVVPIMDYSHIGDFKSLGMKYIKLQDLKNNQLTDEITQLKFAKENYKVIASLKKLQSEGLSKLKQAIKSGS